MKKLFVIIGPLDYANILYTSWQSSNRGGGGGEAEDKGGSVNGERRPVGNSEG